MPDQTPSPAPAVAVSNGPLGHSRAAHRVHGWCSLCKDFTLAEEVLAWQVWAAERQAREDAAAEPGPYRTISAEADPPARCPECGELLLNHVTVRVVTKTGQRVAGGWAYCTGCDATPHPVMPEVDGG